MGSHTGFEYGVRVTGYGRILPQRNAALQGLKRREERANSNSGQHSESMKIIWLPNREPAIRAPDVIGRDSPPSSGPVKADAFDSAELSKMRRL